jgi:hypothetical protein
MGGTIPNKAIPRYTSKNVSQHNIWVAAYITVIYLTVSRITEEPRRDHGPSPGIDLNFTTIYVPLPKRLRRNEFNNSKP